MNTFKVAYKCGCMSAEKEIDVTPRPPNGDLVLWTQYVVGGTITVDHRAEYPGCKAVVMEYVKIPVDESVDGIGKVTPHLHS